MHNYPSDETLSGPYLIKTFSPTVIESCLELLSPSSFRITHVSSDFNPDADLFETAKWYGTR